MVLGLSGSLLTKNLESPYISLGQLPVSPAVAPPLGISTDRSSSANLRVPVESLFLTWCFSIHRAVVDCVVGFYPNVISSAPLALPDRSADIGHADLRSRSRAG